MTPPTALGAIWNGPRVECWHCGVAVTPTVITPNALIALAFWSIPTHAAFAILSTQRVPACVGSGRLLGPVNR